MYQIHVICLFGHDEVKLISILEFGFVSLFRSRTGVARFELWLFSLNFEESQSYSGDITRKKFLIFQNQSSSRKPGTISET